MSAPPPADQDAAVAPPPPGLGTRLARRFPHWRFAVVAAALVASLLTLAGAALQTHLAWRAQEEGARREVMQYALYAARLVGDEIIRTGLEQRMRLLGPVMAVPAEDGVATSLSGFVGAVEAMLAGDELAEDDRRGYLRLPLVPDDTVEVRGLPDSLARVIVAAMRERLPGAERSDEPLMVTLVHQGEPMSVMYARQFDDAGRPLAAFAVVVSRRANFTRNARHILTRTPLLPPSFSGQEWDMGEHMDARTGAFRRAPAPDAFGTDTLLSVRITDQEGNLLFATPVQYGSAFAGEYRFVTRPGGFVVHTALREDVAERLSAIPAPHTERWLLAAFLFLGVAAAAVGVMQLRREQELVRLRREFLSSVSHELRTPLAQIRMFAEMLLLGRVTSEEQRGRWLGVIGRESRRLGDMVENILLFSRAEEQRLRLNREWTDVSALVESVLTGFEPFAEQRGVQVDARVAEGVEADVDPGALRQVLTNLLDNALKYGPQGQTVTVELGVDAVGRIVLAVADQGPGIAAADRERVWAPYVRLTSAGGTAGGSGLGLAVVREIARRHGGWSRVESPRDGGARFVVALPRGERPTPAIGLATGEWAVADRQQPATELRQPAASGQQPATAPDSRSRS